LTPPLHILRRRLDGRRLSRRINAGPEHGRKDRFPGPHGDSMDRRNLGALHVPEALPRFVRPPSGPVNVASAPAVAAGPETGNEGELHRPPPRIASTRSQTIAPIMREPTARTPRAETRDWIRFMGLNGPDNRSAGGMVQRSAAECNEKI
jgi:hypothetical protein